MPQLYYGKLDGDKKRRLYGINLRPIEVSIFDYLKIKKLAPVSYPDDIAHLWHYRSRNQTIVAWNEDNKERSLILVGLHFHEDAITIMREDFPLLVPSPILFRWANEQEAYLYD